jgi:septal ring factor EnvC (AmiA/AmiB activator)
VKLFCFFAASLPGLLAAASGEMKESKKDLRQIQREKRYAERRLRKEERAEASVMGEISQLNHSVDAKRNDVRTFESNLAKVQDRLAELSRAEAGRQQAVTRGRARLGFELRAAQRQGGLGAVKLLLSSRRPSELMLRYRFTRTLARQGIRDLNETRDGLAKIAEFKRETQLRELELQNYRDGAEKARRNALLEQRRRTFKLDAIRKSRGQTQALLDGLNESARKLQDKIAELQRLAEASSGARHLGHIEIDAGPSQLGRHHSLAWPVRGRLLSRFGEHVHPKYKDIKIFNRGIEIAAPLGSPVLAAADGTVRFAGDFEGYGQMLVLDHGGANFSIYGYNSNLLVKEGEEVSRGQKIAELGDSSPQGRPELYFEIRQKAKAVDPLLWLGR